MQYDPENIFAKILKGEIPSFKVYEDEYTYCFMDIMPRTDGHSLVIPKAPCRNMLDANPAQLAACMATVQKISHACMKAFGTDGITLQQFSEAAGGQEVFHLHFHIHPRYTGIPMRSAGKMGNMDLIKSHADTIAAAIEYIPTPELP